MEQILQLVYFEFEFWIVAKKWTITIKWPPRIDRELWTFEVKIYFFLEQESTSIHELNDLSSTR